MTTRVMVTRASDQAGPLEAALRAHGLLPVPVPAIAIAIDAPGGPLDAAARNLGGSSWVVITSPNGARAILTAAERVSTVLKTPSWAVIGEATGEVLERQGIEIAFRPSRTEARTLAAELPLERGHEVAVIRGDLAGDRLAHRLRERGAQVTDVIAYRTIEAPPSSRVALRAAFDPGPPDAVVFASGSSARGLVSLAEAEHLDVRGLPAVCIGLETAREAARLGFEVIATPPVPDANALAAATAAALAQPLESR